MDQSIDQKFPSFLWAIWFFLFFSVVLVLEILFFLTEFVSQLVLLVMWKKVENVYKLFVLKDIKLELRENVYLNVHRMNSIWMENAVADQNITELKENVDNVQKGHFTTKWKWLVILYVEIMQNIFTVGVCVTLDIML